MLDATMKKKNKLKWFFCLLRHYFANLFERNREKKESDRAKQWKELESFKRKHQNLKK